MLPASRSGNTSTLARPATALAPFTFLAATASESAASPCSSPSTARSGRSVAHQFERRAHLVDAGVAGAAVGGERQQRHARLVAEQASRAVRRGDGNVGQLRRRRIGVQRAVGKDVGPGRAVGRRHDHQEEARGCGNAGRQADRDHPGLDHPPRRVGDAGHHRRGVAGRDHGAREVERSAQHALGHSGRHLVAARGDVGCIGRQARVALRVAHLAALEPHAEAVRKRAHLGNGPKQHGRRQARLAQALRAPQDAFVLAFRQYDLERAAPDGRHGFRDDIQCPPRWPPSCTDVGFVLARAGLRSGAANDRDCAGRSAPGAVTAPRQCHGTRRSGEASLSPTAAAGPIVSSSR